MATWLLGSIKSSINHEQVKGVLYLLGNACYNPSFFIYTKSNQSTTSCSGNPQAITRKCVQLSMPHLLGNRAKIPKCNLHNKFLPQL